MLFFYSFLDKAHFCYIIRSVRGDWFVFLHNIAITKNQTTSDTSLSILISFFEISQLGAFNEDRLQQLMEIALNVPRPI
jgi:hypothetical protein